MNSTSRPSTPLWLLRLSNTLTLVMFIIVLVLAAWLSRLYISTSDWTFASRNTLSEAAQRALTLTDGPVSFTVYVRTHDVLKPAIAELLGRFAGHKTDIDIAYIDPDAVPDQVRELGISGNFDIRAGYKGNSQSITQLTEAAISHALERLGRAGERWVIYLTGHGERDMLGEANHDLGLFARQLKERGFQVQGLTLLDAGEVPANTAVLILSEPQQALSPLEQQLLLAYIDGGGQLLWLTEPAAAGHLSFVADVLGITFGNGVIVDPTTRVYGIEHPSFTLVTAYPPHPAVQDFRFVTIFPQTVALTSQSQSGFSHEVLLSTGSGAWSETGPLEGDVVADSDETRGPLNVALALVRRHGAAEQRMVVVGDGDFLSNAYVGNGGNLELGMNLINWLTNDDQYISTGEQHVPDRVLMLSGTEKAVMGIFNLFVLPLILFSAGLLVWWYRRR